MFKNMYQIYFTFNPSPKLLLIAIPRCLYFVYSLIYYQKMPLIIYGQNLEILPQYMKTKWCKDVSIVKSFAPFLCSRKNEVEEL